jgi:fatty acid desaturase
MGSNNRKIFLAAIPDDIRSELNRLSRHNRIYDGLTFIAVFTSFFFLMWFSDYFYNNFLSAILFIVIQGFVLHTVAQMIHEYLVHDHFLVKYLKYPIVALVPLSPTQYNKIHIAHHKYFPNSPEDPDRAVNLPRSRLERILAFTFLNDLLLVPRRAKFYGEPQPPVQFTPSEKKHIQFELSLFIVLVLLAIILALVNHPVLLQGWLLPLIFGLPLFTGLRVFAEHSHVDESQPFGCGTNIRVPAILSITPYVVLFGEGHIVHHYYPHMPWYNCKKACDLLRPWMANASQKNRLFYSIWRWVQDGPHVNLSAR